MESANCSVDGDSEGGSLDSRGTSGESITRASLGPDAEHVMSSGARASSELELGSSADLLSRRRASASVEEIRNLYSALQELVPGSTPNVNQPVSGVEDEVEQDREATKPNALQIPNDSCLQVQQPRKRLLPTPPGSPRLSDTFQQSHGNGGKKVTRSGAKDRGGGGHPSPSPSRKSLQLELEVPKEGGHSVDSQLSLRRRSTGNCLSPDYAGGNQAEVANGEEKSKKGRFSPFVKRKLLSPFSRRRGSTPNLVIETTDERQSLSMKPKYASEKSALRSPLASRRDSLSETITMLTRSDSIEALLKERDRRNAARGSAPRELEASSRGGSLKNLERLEDRQMELLLSSLGELQKAAGVSSYGTPPTDSEVMQRLEERRGSLGTEMRELLETLKELTDGTTSRGTSSPASSPGDAASRRSSFHDCVTPTQRESLDSLEAYFNEKLRDATKGKTAPNSPEAHPSVFAMPPNLTEGHDDKDQTDGTDAGMDNAPPKSAGEEKMENASRRGSGSGGRKTDPPTGRTQRKKDRQEFALQVNDKLGEWLTRATALTSRDKTTRATFEDENGNETLERSSKRKVFSKRSFKRQGGKANEMYRTRRSRSMHDVFANEEAEDAVEKRRQEPVAQNIMISVSGLPVSVGRSQSMVDVTNAKKLQCKRYASHESSNNVAGKNSDETQADGRSRQDLPLASQSDKKVRKPRILPKEPVLKKKSSDQPNAAVKSADHAQRKRTSRLPVDLPVFYCPMATVQHDCSSIGEATNRELSTSTPDIKKSLFPQTHKRRSANLDHFHDANELFYLNKDSEVTSGTHNRPSASCVGQCPGNVDGSLLQNSRFNSKPMPLFYKEHSREDQNLQRDASHDSLARYSDDCRDGMRSDSDDSGCPGNEFNGNEIAVQTEPFSQLNESERARESRERLNNSSRTLRRLRSSTRHSREVSDLGVTV